MKKASIRQSEPLGPRLGSPREQERHNMTVITGGKNIAVMFDLQLPLTCSPWTTLSNPCNNVRGKILLKKSSCVFLPASYLACVFVTASVIIASVCIQHIYVYFCMNQQMRKKQLHANELLVALIRKVMK